MSKGSKVACSNFTSASTTEVDRSVQCRCSYDDVNDHMIRCNRCFLWEHKVCMGIERDTVAQTYICEKCRSETMKESKTESSQKGNAEVLVDDSSDESDENVRSPHCTYLDKCENRRRKYHCCKSLCSSPSSSEECENCSVVSCRECNCNYKRDGSRNDNNYDNNENKVTGKHKISCTKCHCFCVSKQKKKRVALIKIEIFSDEESKAVSTSVAEVEPTGARSATCHKKSFSKHTVSPPSSSDNTVGISESQCFQRQGSQAAVKDTPRVSRDKEISSPSKRGRKQKSHSSEGKEGEAEVTTSKSARDERKLYAYIKFFDRIENESKRQKVALDRKDNKKSKTSQLGRQPDELKAESSFSDSTENETGYVIRCICGYDDDDGFTIACDRCNVWQHVDCVLMDRNEIPDNYLCEKCEPRDVSVIRAKNLQDTKRKMSEDSSSSTKQIRKGKHKKRNTSLKKSNDCQPIQSFPEPSENYEQASSVKAPTDSIHPVIDLPLSTTVTKDSEVTSDGKDESTGNDAVGTQEMKSDEVTQA